MKTYIINLERSEKRRKHIVAEAEKHGLDYELFKAVDGSKLTEADRAEFCDADAIIKYPDWLTPGMLGCALSHYKLYEKIIEDREEIALVLEDDTILADGFSELVSSVESEIKPNEIISLYYMSFSACMLSNQDSVGIANGYSLRYPIDIQQPISTAGYFITHGAAKTMAKVVRPIRVSPDSWGYFYENGGFRSFRCVYPSPIKITAVQSDIHSENIRGKFVRILENSRIPGFSQIIKQYRLRNISRLSHVELVDRRSPLAVQEDH